MHVTVVGAGVLGRVYGVRLVAGGDRASFVVRPERVAETTPFVIEQVNGPRRRDAIDAPERVARIPASTAAVLLTVRFDQLVDPSSALLPVLQEAPAVPLVVLTPMLPRERIALERALGRRITAAMPGAAGYIDERDVARYWTTPLAPTLVDNAAVATEAPALDALLFRLGKAGLASHRERDVAGLNAATTVAFFPLVAAIDAGGGVDGLLADGELCAIVIEAARETEALGQKVGKVASWATLLTRFVGPYTLKPGVTLARRLAPEAVRFVEAHFGPKLHAQHLAMGRAIMNLAAEHQVAVPALARLMDVLRGPVAPASPAA